MIDRHIAVEGSGQLCMELGKGSMRRRVVDESRGPASTYFGVKISQSYIPQRCRDCGLPTPPFRRCQGSKAGCPLDRDQAM